MAHNAITNSGRLDDISGDTLARPHAAVVEHGRHAIGEGVELREAVFPLLEGERHPLTHFAPAPFRHLRRWPFVEENSILLLSE